MVSIVIGGDVCPHGSSFAELACKEDLLAGVASCFKDADAVAINLECPLTDTKQAIGKTGPSVRAPQAVARKLKDAGVTICAMANNHIMDFGPDGLADSVSACTEAGMLVTGVGENLEEAQKPLIMDLKGFRMGIIACAENEWSIADRNTPGANPLDMPDLLETTTSLRAEVDAIIVLVHGGREHYPLPYPKLQHWCRHLVRAGANAVICQHSHYAGAYEEYESGFISYGQGNLVFPTIRSNMPPSFFSGYLVKFSFDSMKNMSWKLLPYSLDVETGIPELMDEERASFMHEKLEELQPILLDPDRLEQEWNKIVKIDEGVFLVVLAGGNRYVRGINRRWPLINKWYTQPKRKLLLNMIRCEAIREAYLSILKR